MTDLYNYTSLMCVNNIISHGNVKCKQLAFSINLSRKKKENTQS